VKRACIVCGHDTPAVDEAWDVGLCHACAADVMAALVGKAIVLDSPERDSDRTQAQVIHRLREGVKGAKLELAGAGR
jgi:hypothetical protein